MIIWYHTGFTMTDILDEVREANREERTNKILNSLLKIVGILALLSIAATAMVSWYSERQKDKTYEVVSKLTSILRKINTPGNNNSELTKDIEALSDGPSSYGALANFYLAAISSANGNLSKMAYYYDKVQSNREYDLTIREHAIINGISIKLQNQSISSEQAIKLINKLMAEDRDTPFFTAITMLKASILAENNQYSDAAEELNIASTSSKSDESLSRMLGGMSMYVNARLNDKNTEDSKNTENNTISSDPIENNKAEQGKVEQSSKPESPPTEHQPQDKRH